MAQGVEALVVQAGGAHARSKVHAVNPFLEVKPAALLCTALITLVPILTTLAAMGARDLMDSLHSHLL
eukprot:514102-Rhodomonas_salina.3